MEARSANLEQKVPASRTKRILLADLDPEDAAALRENLGPDVVIWSFSSEDTMVADIGGADMVIANLSQGHSVLYRIARLLGDNAHGCKLFTIGNETIPDELRQRFPTLRALRVPIDFSYIRRVLDSAQIDSARIRSLGEEQSRVRGLYEISSALLKVVNRMHIAPVLEQSLPELLDSYMILLVFPADPHPIIFLHAPEGLSVRILDSLRQHLREAWEILRTDQRVEWDWLTALADAPDDDLSFPVKPSSFMTTPISSGSQTRGFLTVLPRCEEDLDETFLQTFFVVGDLISVLIHNLELRERLEDRAMHDGLTKLLNRQTLMENLEKECRRSQRYGQSICVVMFDIDHFKRINDRYGHQAGDEALRFVADKLRESVREMDLAGRCGGEEFISILVNTDIEGGKNWAERFRRQLEEATIHHKGKDIKLTASFGVAAASGAAAVVDQMIGRADDALYKAKAGGRNVVVVDQSETPTKGVPMEVSTPLA